MTQDVATREQNRSEELARLEEFRGGSPYPFEPPRRSLLVDAWMAIARRRGWYASWPDYGSPSTELVQLEYDSGYRTFWDGFRGVLAPADLAGKDILDVGCGWAGKIIRLAEEAGARSVAGFDLPGVFEPQVVYDFVEARGMEGSTWKTGYAEDIPFDSDACDVAVLDDVMEHVDDPARVIAECWRVLRPGGLVLMQFPSIRSITSHHFNRAIGVPGLHYMASMKTWCAGLNDYLLRHPDSAYTPFPQVRVSKSGHAVSNDLSGLDVATFSRLVDESGFVTRQLELLGAPITRRESASPLLLRAYDTLRSLSPLREPLSSRISYIGEKPAR